MRGGGARCQGRLASGHLPPPPLLPPPARSPSSGPSPLPPLGTQVVSETELAALVDEYSSGKRRGVTARFLAVLRENAGSAAAAGGDASAGSSSEAEGVTSAAAASSGGSSQGLVPLYQQLYAVAVLQTLQSCLEAPEAAAAQLSDLAPAAASGGSSFFGAEGSSQLEAALAAAAAEQQGAAGDRSELEHRLSQQVTAAGLRCWPCGGGVTAAPTSCWCLLPARVACQGAKAAGGRQGVQHGLIADLLLMCPTPTPPTSRRRTMTALLTSPWKLQLLQCSPCSSCSRRRHSQPAATRRQRCLRSLLRWPATSATIA